MTLKSRTSANSADNAPDFCAGMHSFGALWPDFEALATQAAIPEGHKAVSDPRDPAAVFQTLLMADALRYVTLQMCASKGSGHPGGFASSAEAYAALVMLGHTHIVTEVGHHAPGFYSAMFLNTSLEGIGVRTMTDLMGRFREQHGLLGHLSGAIPGIHAPAGPLGQGQHFAMAGALLHPGTLFPVTIGDGGLGEPYILSAIKHFHTSYPDVTNFLPILVWNGYSQEHHSMVSRLDNDEMRRYWESHGIKQVLLVDAKDYDDKQQEGPYVDSTQFSFAQRLAFGRAVLETMDRAARAALGGTLTAVIIKQLKGAGVHTSGAKSHNLYPGDTLDKPHIIESLKKRALAPEAWAIVRKNFIRAGGGPAASTMVTERELEITKVGAFPLHAYALLEKVVPSTAVGALAAWLGTQDPRFVVTNADGNEASGLKNINDALKIRHPTPDPLYNQEPRGQVYEPLSEDACAGLAAGLALFGSRSLWLSYESFAINGWPIVQTVTQAMAELRRKTPSLVCLFTAGALEQGRNGWTHQRPEIENYIAAQMRNGNVYLLFPPDANTAQAAYEYAATSWNKGMAIIASKTALPIFLTLEASQKAVREGAAILYESQSGTQGAVVFAVTGDMILLAVFAAKDLLEARGFTVRIVSVINPRQLYRPGDIAATTVALPDTAFMDDDHFARLFDGDRLLAISGGPSAPLEPVLLRTRARARATLAWKRGDTTATTQELFAFNGLTAEAIVARVIELDQ